MRLRCGEIAWTSVFTLNRDPLEVRISKAELDFDQKQQRPTNAELRRAGIEWRSLFGPLPSYMREHPTVEGARYLIDELVCVARRVERRCAREQRYIKSDLLRRGCS